MINQRLKIYLIFNFIVLFTFPIELFGKDAETFISLEKVDRVNLSKDSYYLTDTDNRFSIEEIISDSSLEWERNFVETPNYGYIPDTIWTKLHLNLLRPQKDDYYLRLDFPSIDYVDVYIYNRDSNSIVLKYLQGDKFVFSERLIPSHVNIFPLPSTVGDHLDIYIKTKTSASHSIPLSLHSIRSLYEEETLVYLLFGMYFGLILAMFVYNSILYLYTKEQSFYLYLFYLSSYFFVIFSGFGFGNRFLYPDNLYLMNHLFLISVAVNGIASILFSVVFLNIKYYYRKFYYTILIFSVLVGVWGLLFALSGGQEFYKLVGVITGIPLISILLVSILVAKKYKYAYYFIIAWTIFLVFYLASYLRLIGILPSNFLTYYGIQIGSALEMLILSMAIGHRLYDYKRKAAEVAEENILVKSQINTELSEIVNQRTSELKQNLKHIKKDIEMARIVQLNTLPAKSDWMSQGIELANLFLPKDRVSGDIYDIIKIGDAKYRILIVDATGHGIQAGFFTMSIRTEYERVKYEFTEPAQVLRLLNSSVFKTFSSLTMLYTCFIVDIDLEQRYLCYASAGHPAQYLFQDGSLTELKSLTHLIGIKEDFDAKSISIPLKKGCKFLFFTDGIFEVFNSDYEEYGSDRLSQFFQKNINLSGEDLIYQLFNDVNDFSKERGIDDDVTVLYFGELE